MNEELCKPMLELQYIINRALENGYDSGTFNIEAYDGMTVHIKFDIDKN